MTSLAEIVATNLVHYNLWTAVEDVVLSSRTVLCGAPPPTSVIATDSSTVLSDQEYVLPLLVSEKLTLATLDGIFREIAERRAGVRPEKVIGGILNTDGTVVYYFIWDGVAKPRKN
ncbi:hypothetical protein BABINDRAFT_9464 [Babjeviella inositovora NRRL Y-12698]|uniref:tRNA-splicing endonuclease subunit Sen15 domain-containing protein n=1 Tax=Babjeviella inositovora NRRL Y-12698 TaxID=984486 RepID=A0A1E3QKM9_9ASCO|nr:uncharacterized protein BABINDRAFT_9464 [Babjeviella inositovora NRRL Y-12698]ODQ78241.1 hypothetical protein BABINDRAFT_9464 [Babjeviella inositovora NRRL Y-12698]